MASLPESAWKTNPVIICHGKAKTDRHIREAARCGAKTREMVTARCDAGNGCGAWPPAIVEVLRETRAQAMRGLVDFDRIREMCRLVQGRIDHMALDRVTPLAAPLFLEVGRVPVEGAAQERLLAEEVSRLMETAGISR